jgi:putative membrane-bound dehydrogenase-like protein
MKLLFPLRILLLGSLAGFPAGAAQFKFPNQTITVPDGFQVELVASPPLAERPVYGSFDEQGRLYVVDSSGSNDKPEKQLQDKPHRLIRLEDTDGDGRFDKTIVFADKLMFPEGCLWYDGSVYVAAPPSIWKFTASNNDGVADVREEWFQGKTLTGCANDLHGPYLGPDGWLYWCKGAFAKQTYERPNRTPFVTRAAHIFRSRPDGSGIEPVMTGGMDNPVSVAFTPEGERILCGTFFITHEPGHRDGLIHAIYGGVYGKINEVTDSHKKTGELMPIMTHMGAAAPCSVIRYQSRTFGKEYQDNLFACYFNLHKVGRHVLEPDGATFKTRDSDFVSSDNPDFHPTDVIEDADGSLLVIDTGGWYKLCCPTSQLPKPDVLGAIYRVRRVSAPKVEDPRGLKLAWKTFNPAELAKLLGDERPAVRKRATQLLGKQGKNAVPVLAGVLDKSQSSDMRREAVWALTRIEGVTAREAVRSALRDGDQSVQQAALHSVSLWTDVGAFQELLALLQEPNPPVQRVAAEALGRAGSAVNLAMTSTNQPKLGDENPLNWIVPGLLTASMESHDRVLEHSLTYALIEIGNPRGTVPGLESSSPYEQRTALIALDQMDDGGLKADAVASLMGSPNPVLRQTAAWVAGHHPDWGGALAGFFRERLSATNLTKADIEELRHQLTQFDRAPEIQGLIASTFQAPSASSAQREVLLRVMADSGLKEPPTEWTTVVRTCLSSKDAVLLPSAIAAAKVFGQARINPPDFSEPLLALAQNDSQPADVRLAALAALPNGLRQVDPNMLSFLCAGVDASKPVPTRSMAASVLAKAELSDAQLQTLAGAMKTAGPLEVSVVLSAFQRSTNEGVGLKLMAALRESKALASVRPDLLKTVATNYPASVQAKGNDVLALLNVDTEKQNAHITELLASLKDGDVRRGQAVFNSQKTACFSCHKLGYLGGDVGPDLTSIGQARTERDLLESVVYPSASFVRSYEPLIVTTKSDEQYSGVVRKDAPDEVVLATGPNAEVRIPRADISEMRPGTVSVMPAGLAEQLSRQELADLLAFLKATRWGPK